MKSLYIVGIVAIVLVAVAFISTDRNNNVLPNNASTSEKAASEVNTYRARNGQNSVIANEALAKLATEWNSQIAFQHTSDFDTFVNSKASVEGQAEIKKFLTDQGYNVTKFGVVWGYGDVGQIISSATQNGHMLTGSFAQTLLTNQFVDIGASTAALDGRTFTFIVLASDK